jgi:hypothetical protein
MAQSGAQDHPGDTTIRFERPGRALSWSTGIVACLHCRLRGAQCQSEQLHSARDHRRGALDSCRLLGAGREPGAARCPISRFALGACLPWAIDRRYESRRAALESHRASSRARRVVSAVWQVP